MAKGHGEVQESGKTQPILNNTNFISVF